MRLNRRVKCVASRSMRNVVNGAFSSLQIYLIFSCFHTTSRLQFKQCAQDKQNKRADASGASSTGELHTVLGASRRQAARLRHWSCSLPVNPIP